MVNSAPDDIQLEQLLVRLLRVVAAPAGPSVLAADPPEGYALGGPEDASHPAGEGQKAAPADPVRADEGSPAVPVQTARKLPVISSSEARALIELMSARGIAQGELAALLGLDKSTVSRLASGLERKGWIRRGRDEGNQRYVRLYLTSQGGEIADRVLHAWQSRQARLLAALSEDERTGLAAGLRGLVRGLAAEGLLGEIPHSGS